MKLCLLFSFFVPAIVVLDASALSERPAFSLSANELLNEAHANPRVNDADVVVLLDEEHWTFGAGNNAPVRHTYRLVFQAITNQGAEDWGSFEQRWEPWHQKKPAIRARVITADGVVHSLDPKTVVETSPGGDQGNMYSDVRILRCPLPAVAAGAIVEEEIEEESTPLLNGEVNQIFMGRSVPVRQATATIDYPEKLPLTYSTFLLPDLKTNKTSSNGITHLAFEAGPFPPREKLEILLPPDVPRAPHIVFSTGGTSWKALASEYNSIVERQVAGAPVEEMVRHATNGIPEADRARAIAALVRELHSQVRYTGVEFGDAAIVPAKPADTLKRKYGDCKDKAALLVAMLRAARIPSHLALLQTGPGEDIHREHAGFGVFDHAIVYVPGTPDLWIDATAQYLLAGFLPSSDQGRLALVIRPDTEALMPTPEAPPSASRLLETREFFMPAFGKARVVETSEGSGSADGALRAQYGAADTEQMRKNLGDYMRREYISQETSKLDHPKGNDFSQPFKLRLEIDNATRGTTAQMDAAVGVPLAGLFHNLPSYFRTTDAKPVADESANPKKPRKVDYQLDEAFISEWRYVIHLPSGFQITKLPEEETLQLGPARFTSRYHSDKDVLNAVYVFDSVKRTYTVAEGEELKRSLTALVERPVLLLPFQPAGQDLLAAGKVPEAISGFTSEVERDPKSPAAHVRLAVALLAIGCGEKARAEARQAVALDPKFSFAQQQLGFILMHDLVGRQLVKGFDAEGAELALRKAIALDPKDLTSLRNLAVLLEHDSNGIRYQSPSRLREAVKVYREMGDDLAANNLTPNLLYALAYLRDFGDLKVEAAKAGATGMAIGFGVLARTHLQSLPAALEWSQKETSDEGVRSTALVVAGEVSLHMREYSIASPLLEAGAKGSAEATRVMQRARAFGQAKRIDDFSQKLDTPENAVRSIFTATLFGMKGSEIQKKFVAAEAREAGSDKKLDEQFARSSGGVRLGQQQANVPMEAFADLIWSIMQMRTDENGKDGRRVHLGIGPTNQTWYLVREKDDFKLLGAASDFSAIGRRVIKDMERGDLEAARRWLNWLREEVKLNGGDDPLGGPIFPRIWSKNESAGAEEIRFVANFLISTGEDGETALPVLRQARETAKDDHAKTIAQLAYVEACFKAKKFRDGIQVAQALYAGNLDSDRALSTVVRGLSELKRWQDAEAAIQQRLNRDPEDITAIRLLANAKWGQNDFTGAEKLWRKAAESSKATPIDWNQWGWSAVLARDVTPEKLDQMLRGLGSPSASALHTLACMYAELSKIPQGREALLSAMRLWGLEEPNEQSWMAFGRLAEKSGVKDEARSDYARSTSESNESPASSATLVRRWLNELGR